jgi:S1-C subfamily serine protease
MRLFLPIVAVAAACVTLPATAQKPGAWGGGGSLGNLPPPNQQPPQLAPQPQRPQQRPQMALPRDKPPPLGAQQAFPQPGPQPGPQQGFGPPPGPMAALPRDKPPPLGAAMPRPPGGQQAGPVPGRPGGGRQPPRDVSSGTGFVVAPRQVMTNQHVAQGCTAMIARSATGQDIPATVIAVDAERDLALLRTDADAGPVLPFRRTAEVRRGENVVTYGFPLAGLLSSGPTLTTGDVSALAGLGDNPRQIQISAPVQQGNSGGPLLDLRGQIIGVIVSKLNAQRIAQATGDIPQNVNFAVKHTEAVDFMREHGVQPQLEDPTGALRTAAEIGEVAHASTVFLRCLR